MRVATTWVPSTAPNSSRAGAGRVQNGSAGTGDEDRQVPGDRQLEVDQRADQIEVQAEDLSGEDEEQEGLRDADQADRGGDGEHSAHVPRGRSGGAADPVVGDGQDRTVVEQREQHDHDRR